MIIKNLQSSSDKSSGKKLEEKQTSGQKETKGTKSWSEKFVVAFSSDSIYLFTPTSR